MGMKTCTVCGESKAFDGFPKAAGCKDGRRSKCKKCMALYKRRYYKERKDELAVQQRRRRQQPRYKEKARDYQCHYREQNKDRINSQRRAHNKTPEGKAQNREAYLRYSQSEKGGKTIKTYRERYNKSDAKKRKNRRYRQSAKGKEMVRRYQECNPERWKRVSSCGWRLKREN